MPRPIPLEHCSYTWQLSRNETNRAACARDVSLTELELERQTATLRARLLMPESLPVGNLTSGVIALDPDQQTIYAISASGLTVATLPSVVDQITPFPWPYAVKSSHVAPSGLQ